jgi:hypothetical protein
VTGPVTGGLRRSWRHLAAAAALALLASLSGCGQDPIDAYCSDLSSHRKQIAGMLDSDSQDSLFTHVDVLKDLAKKSPSDLQDEWQTFLDAVDDLQAALEHAGVKASQFTAGKPPADLSAADRKAIVEAATQLSSDDVVAAANGISQEATDVCKINLGL